MDDELILEEMEEEEDTGSVIPHRPVQDTGDLDITPMIDITFLLLIFFLVASRPDAQTSVDLPPARHGQGVSQNTSAIITIDAGGDPHAALIYLADGKVGKALDGTPEHQAAAIEAYVREEKKETVLVKAAKDVIHEEVARVSAAVGRVEGIKLHWAVFELE